MFQDPPLTLPKLAQADLATPLHEAQVTYQSKVLGETRTYVLVLPPGYAAHPDQHYPVIFLLHGGHGYPTSWFDQGSALKTLEQLYQTGKLPPSIVIAPDGNDKRGSSPYWDPKYLDGKDGNVATAIGNELVHIVRSQYRTLPAPKFWAIGGLSSGGWGAFNIGLHFPKHFGVLFSHSGYFVDKSDPQNSPLDLIQNLPESTLRQLKIYLDAGQLDQEFLPTTEAFHEVLNRLNVANEFHTFPGSHSWAYWREHLADSLSFVGKQFQLQNSDSRPI